MRKFLIAFGISILFVGCNGSLFPQEDFESVQKTIIQHPTEEEIPFLGKWGYANHFIDLEFYDDGTCKMGHDRVYHRPQESVMGEWRTTGKLGTIEIRFMEKTSWAQIDYCVGKWSKATLRRHGIAPNQLWPSVYLTYGNNGLACMDFEGTHINYQAALLASNSTPPAKN
jgi:hypothetical protein